MRMVALSAFVLLVAGCTTQTVKTVNSVTAIKADQQLREEALLDVGLVVFDPGVPAGAVEAQDDVYPEVRRAEARYVPYLLRSTLEKTNQWGAVRVLPEVDPASELQVSGRILKSDGVELAVQVWAIDATGRRWLDKTYDDIATQFAYRDDIDYDADPFQDLYNSIANDLLKARKKLTPAQLKEIRNVASLKYAAELSPAAFGNHLRVDKKGRTQVNRLPSDGDPMLARVNRIRESEYLFIDTVDQQYANFYTQMDPSYDQWRRYSYEEVLAREDVKRSARTRALAGLLGIVGGAAVSNNSNNPAVRTVGTAAALGGIYALKQGYDTYQQAKIHEAALKELAASFDAEIKPIVVEVEGEVVKLSGSLEAQYAEWRRMMREIYEAETGWPARDPVPVANGAR